MDFEILDPQESYEPSLLYGKEEVNRELSLAWEIIENTGSNLFLTGKAGTGKTTFLKKLRECSEKRMVVLAPTGVAAINASGVTIHSFFQLPFAPYIPGKGFLTKDKKFLNVSKQKKALINSLSLLVIDEISMVSPDVLDAIDSILRRLRHSTRPFGGIQLLLIGDLRQLPPVVTNEDWEQLKTIYSSAYFFESKALKQAGFQTIELSTVYRQTDREFINILNKIRDGQIDQETLNHLNQRCAIKDKSDDNGYIRLTTHNHRASLINDLRLESLQGAAHLYKAEIEGNFPESSFPAEKYLTLKEGAQVMFVKNDSGSKRKYYNGLIGRIISLSDNKIRVKIPETGQLIDVEKTEWENTKYVLNEVTNKVEQESIGKFRQFPLQPAWAITIHKSQGLTFDKAIIDTTYSFAPGQTYVALSRCRNLEGLILDSPVTLNSVIIDKTISEFTNTYKSLIPKEEEVKFLKKRYQYDLFLELFDFDPIKHYFNDIYRFVSLHANPDLEDAEVDLYYCRNKIDKDLWMVSRKFTASYSEQDVATALSKPSSQLNQRIKNGAKYFTKILDEIEFYVDMIPACYGKISSKYFTNLLQELKFQIKLKKKIFKSISITGFSVILYQTIKEKSLSELEKSYQLKTSKKSYYRKNKKTGSNPETR